MDEQDQGTRNRCFKKHSKNCPDEDKLLNIIAGREAYKLKREDKHRYENNVISPLSNTKLYHKQLCYLSKSVMGCVSDRVIPLLKLTSVLYLMTSKKQKFSIALSLSR